MDWMALAAVLFSAGIFLGFLSLLLVGFNTILSAKIAPLKENQVRFDAELKEVKARLVSLEKGQNTLAQKLDKILARQAG